MYPSSPPQGIPDSERHVWRSLRALDNDWSVFHGVAWQGERGGRQAEGEGDFILVNPSQGLLCLEVKGGREFRVEKGKWSRRENAGFARIADPFEQAASTQREVVKRIQELGIRDFGYGHAIALPQLQTAEGLGLRAHEATVLTRPKLQDVSTSIGDLVMHWNLKAALDPGDMTEIAGLLSPTTQLRAKLNDDLVLVRARIEAWTQEQMAVLDGLVRNRRTLVYGGAGTGKTILAMEKARRLARVGKRSLIVTFNFPVAHWIKGEVADESKIDVHHFHDLVRKLADRAKPRSGTLDDLARWIYPDKPADDWYEGPDADLLISAAAEVGYTVDAVIVDEGQDFAPHHWAGLELLLADPGVGEFHVFLDRHQALYRDDWQPPFDGLGYDLSRNCRNSKQIAGLVAVLMQEAGEPAMVEGPDPIFISVSNVEGAVKALKGSLHEVINEGGVSPKDVVILSSERAYVDALRGGTLAGVELVRPPSTDGVRVETVHRFKGLEADVVFLILPTRGRGEDGVLDDYQRMLAYVGMSRARSYLCVLAKDRVGEALGLTA
jgi:hypothetical protein